MMNKWETGHKQASAATRHKEPPKPLALGLPIALSGQQEEWERHKSLFWGKHKEVQGQGCGVPCSYVVEAVPSSSQTGLDASNLVVTVFFLPRSQGNRTLQEPSTAPQHGAPAILRTSLREQPRWSPSRKHTHMIGGGRDTLANPRNVFR